LAFVLAELAVLPVTRAWLAPRGASALSVSTGGVGIAATAPSSPIFPREILPAPHDRHRRLFALWAASQDRGDNEDESTVQGDGDDGAEPIVTAEMFWRDVLADPPPTSASPSSAVVKRPAGSSNSSSKKSAKFKEYRVLDNRDTLPFSVRASAPPDPYTRPETKTRRPAPRSSPRNGKRASARADAIENRIASKLYSVKGNRASSSSPSSSSSSSSSSAPAQTLLGEFALDKHTTTGDVLEIGETQYRVVSHRCLYKYAGGKRFVMTQKILHVKEVGRYQAEEYLRRQWNAKGSKAETGAPGDAPQEP
jgi:hypothetical protein